LVARIPAGDGTRIEGPRSSHDAITAAVRTSTRSDIGVVTSRGRLVRLPVVDLPALPATAGPPNLTGGVALHAFVHLHDDEQAVGLVPLTGAPIAIGTATGVVKRVNLDLPANKNEWEIIALKDDDTVVGAASCADHDDLVFISTAGVLLRFGASSVRPQGRAAAGMAGMKLTDDATVVCFAVARDDDVVVTVAADASGHATSAKVTSLDAFPHKGRGTQGVRCQRLLVGETALRWAAVGPDPAACDAAGAAVALPEPDDRRDGSGDQVDARLQAVGGGIRPDAPPAGVPDTPADA
jgi:DNA gyrase subunit A